MVYAANAEYSHCDSWFMIDVDLSAFEGKQQRINIALPDVLIKRIDGYVSDSSGVYKDRSHFWHKLRDTNFPEHKKRPSTGLFLFNASFC
jgi:hypothetical protein